MPDEDKSQTRKALRLQPLSEILLYKLYQCHIEDDDKDSYDIIDIKEILLGEVSSKMILSALAFLNYDRYGKQPLIRRHGKSGSYSFSISNEGILNVESSLNKRNSVATYLSNNPDTDLNEIAGFDGIFYNVEERMNASIWHPLSIDREDQAYKDTMVELENAFEIIRGDNGFAEKMPETRNGIVNSLQDGISSLKKNSVTISEISALIVKPLKWIVVNFGGSVIGEAAKKAAEKIISFLSSLF